ncbi:MAG TPA: Z1 domain-containing protein [Fodinibius sp.]|nr:Z1 domain-containing protein [Fodinibius sp.]
MENAAQQLIEKDTSVEKPGILLGMIQSGKTRAFIGMLAKCFDEGYDVAIVLTKSSKALVEQTVRRIKDEFNDPYDHDHLDVYDIMSLPKRLTPFILNKKLIFVVKKEKHNLKRLHELFFKKHPELSSKRALMVDDEADFASVTYATDKSKPDGVRFGTLAGMISDFRKNLSSASDFLQVTATPYSLYLQPEEIEINNGSYEPLRPRFTEVLKGHKSYTGGSYYFEESLNEDSPASNLYISVPEREFERLKKADKRYLKSILATRNLRIFRFGLMNFLVGGSIRMLQENADTDNGFLWQKVFKCAYLIHTEHSTDAHAWQVRLTRAFFDRLQDTITNNWPSFKKLVKESHENISKSVDKTDFELPEFTEVVNRVKKAIIQGEVGVKEVNSRDEIINHLDDKGQLRLDNPFNIFIGGQVLDRGITIDNLIGFFYGRNPRSFQMDTVLQHSRMYGARSPKDLAVTRIYTSPRIYSAMRRMYEFDKTLRETVDERGNNGSIQFIEREPGGGIRPCGPSKVRISDLRALNSFSRHLPVGFQTSAATTIKSIVNKIDGKLEQLKKISADTYVCSIAEAKEILNLINSTYEYKERWDNEGWDWNLNAFKEVLEYSTTFSNEDKVYLLYREGRRISRTKNNDTTFSDAPDDGRNDIIPAKKIAQENPAIVLLKQKGKKEDGWRGHEFYWPIMFTPRNTRPSIYTEN